MFGAANQIRTDDLILTKDALCRLSYSSIRFSRLIIIAKRGAFCQYFLKKLFPPEKANAPVPQTQGERRQSHFCNHTPPAPARTRGKRRRAQNHPIRFSVCAVCGSRGKRRRVQNPRSRPEGVPAYAESERTGIEKRIIINGETRSRFRERVSTLKSVSQCKNGIQSRKH